MKHLRKTKKLDRARGPRKALIKNLASSLVLHRSIKTTKAKARVLAPQFEKLITQAKKNSVAARRNVGRILTADAVAKLFKEIVPAYTERHGGYTRITKTGRRLGDGAEMAIIELV